MFATDEDSFRYKNRQEAATILADRLRKYKGKGGVVLAIPRGGVPIAIVIAKELGFSLDLALSKKIGHPLHKEYAIGAVSPSDSFVEDRNDVPEKYIEDEIQKIRERLSEMYRDFMANKPPESLTGKIIIIVDDGVATGNTLLSTIRIVKKHAPEKIIVAVPVASWSAIDKLSKETNEIVCPHIPEYFIGVGGFYENFEQVSDDEVKYYLEEYRKKVKSEADRC